MCGESYCRLLYDTISKALFCGVGGYSLNDMIKRGDGFYNILQHGKTPIILYLPLYISNL